MAVKESNTRFVIQLTKAKKDVVMKIAKEDGRSVSNWINRLIDIYLREHNIKVDEE